MRRSLFVALALCAAPGYERFSTRQELAFTPEEGLELTETHERRYLLELVDISSVVVIDDEEHQRELGDVEGTISSVKNVEFTDEYIAVDGDRPTEVRRTYDAISTELIEAHAEGDGDSVVSEKTGASELEELSVVFTWDDDAEEYGAEYDGEEADEDLLDELEIGSVLARFLSDDEVEEGDSWEVDVDAFNKLSAPGGYLAILTEGEDEDEDRDSSRQIADNLEGDIVATFDGLREVDGEEFAVVLLTLELVTEVEREGKLEEQDGVERRIGETASFEFELEGELLWDVAAGLPRSLQLEGDMSITIVSRQEISAPRGELEIVQTREYEGVLAFEVSVE